MTPKSLPPVHLPCSMCQSAPVQQVVRLPQRAPPPSVPRHVAPCAVPKELPCGNNCKKRIIEGLQARLCICCSGVLCALCAACSHPNCVWIDLCAQRTVSSAMPTLLPVPQAPAVSPRCAQQLPLVSAGPLRQGLLRRLSPLSLPWRPGLPAFVEGPVLHSGNATWRSIPAWLA